MTPNRWLAVAGLVGFTGVALGAFGAHGLRKLVAPELLEHWETGARYQMYHALALGLVAAVMPRIESGLLQWAAWLLLLGVVLFSGSLYLLVLTGKRGLGAVTPFGGVAMLAGWMCLVWAAWKAH